MAIIVTVGMLSGGCSMRLGTMFDKSKDDGAEVTGSIARPAQPQIPARAAMAANLEETDLTLAREAAAELFSRNSKDTSQPWENPKTGARGMVTPVAAAYADGGLTCRDFLASYVRDSAETWLQGDACKSDGGRWEVRSMTPWKRT